MIGRGESDVASARPNLAADISHFWNLNYSLHDWQALFKLTNCSCSSLRILHTYELQLRYIQVLRDKNNDMKSSELSLSIHVIYCKLNIYWNMRCSGSVSEPIVLKQLYTRSNQSKQKTLGIDHNYNHPIAFLSRIPKLCQKTLMALRMREK